MNKFMCDLSLTILSVSIWFLIIFVLVGCGSNLSRFPNNENLIADRHSCCCAKLEGEGYKFNLWICENPPYRRGACKQMRQNACEKGR